MVTPLKKICIISSLENEEKILNFLQDFGNFHVFEFRKGEVGKFDLDYQIAKVNFSLEFLKNFKKKEKENLKEKLTKVISPKIEIDIKKLEETISFFNWEKIIQEVEKAEIDLSEVSFQIKRIDEEMKKFYPFKNLDLNLEEIKKTKNFSFILGRINLNYKEKFLNGLEKKIKFVEVREISQIEKNSYFLIIFLKEVEKDLEKFLEENHFEKEELPPIYTSFKNYYKKLKEEKKNFEARLNEINEKIDNLVPYIDKLKIIFDWLNWQKEKDEVKEKSAKTSYTFALLGWVEEGLLNHLKEGISKITKEYEILELPIKEGETIPILLKNKEFFSDFETVTNVYGAPLYHEPDPTPFLTPFFILFFAICLSDAGYGLVLAILSLFIIKFLKLPKKNKKFFRLFLWLGIATFFVGALFGSWFGIEIETIPDSLKPVRDFLLKIKIIDPVKNPLQLLIISLVLGIFQILTGLSISLWWKIKNKMVKEGIFDHLPWIFLISSILIFIASSSNFLPMPKNFAKYLVLAGAIFVVLTQGRKQKSIFLKIPAGIISLYGLIGYLSDTLSYSRLLALGLATSIIAMVINLIAKIFSQMLPVVGILASFLVLIVGHLFNIGINALGAFIHSARLQFVEFFPKFMEGGGARFKPFKKEGKYIRIINND
jgi:V/A-type H+-transporting ATPase subunit I